MVNFSSPRQ